MRRLSAALLVAAVALPALVVSAEHTHFWRQADSAEFEKGTANGVAMRSDGRLTPAPKFATYSDPNLAYLWQLRTDSRGRVYAAGGSDAKVLRFDDPAKPTTVFESGELSAQTIAFDARDNLYVGTSPDGKIYKVTPDGTKTTYFDPKAKYIWALAVDAQGVLYVGTGDKGEIFAVAPGGSGKLFYQSDERHARSLAFDAKGNLLVGTDPDGLILRIAIDRKGATEPPVAGASFVLWETNKKEVTSLAIDAKGTLYAAAIGEKQRTPANLSPGAVFPLVQAAGGGSVITSQATVPGGQVQAAVPVITPFPFFPSTTGGSEVVKIVDGAPPLVVWQSREDLVFSMGIGADGKVLLGTGNKGTIVRLESDTVYSTIAKPPSSQVTSLIAGKNGQVLAGTANPGKIFTLGPGDEMNGSYESQTFDTKLFSHWGRLAWWGDRADKRVSFYVRSGNTASPEKNWSAWAGPYRNASGEDVKVPAARFVQWKATFDEGGMDVTKSMPPPEIAWVSVAYQPDNVAPVVDDIVIQDPNVRVQGFAPAAPMPGATAPVQLKMPQRAGGASPLFPVILPGADAGGGSKAARVEVPQQGFEDKGYRSVIWLAHDDNDDDLMYSVWFRSEGDTTWRLLKDKLNQRFYTWDTGTMPDGPYYLKIVASDLPTNPPNMALESNLVSDRFEIDNTAPQVQGLRADAVAGGAKVSFQGVSNSGAIDRARYSVDAGEWFVVFPEGLLSDSPKEAYSFSVSGLAPGEHTIAVQVADRFDNTSVAKVNFTVPGASGAAK
jgi:hypothetical protein